MLSVVLMCGFHVTMLYCVGRGLMKWEEETKNDLKTEQ